MGFRAYRQHTLPEITIVEGLSPQFWFTRSSSKASHMSVLRASGLGGACSPLVSRVYGPLLG